MGGDWIVSDTGVLFRLKGDNAMTGDLYARGGFGYGRAGA